MDKNLQEKLFQKYPKIFKENVPAQYPFDQWGVECKNGWFDLIDKLCFKIQEEVDTNNLPQVEFLQLKEKFGFFRAYINSGNNYIYNLIDDAEEKSGYICEYCGSDKNISRNKDGWVKTLCNKCRKNK